MVLVASPFLYVRAPFSVQRLENRRTNVREVLYWGIFYDICRHRFSLKSDSQNGHFTWRRTSATAHILSVTVCYLLQRIFIWTWTVVKNEVLYAQWSFSVSVQRFPRYKRQLRPKWLLRCLYLLFYAYILIWLLWRTVLLSYYLGHWVIRFNIV